MKGTCGYFVEPQNRSIEFQNRLARHVRGTQTYLMEPQLQYLNEVKTVEAYVDGKWVSTEPLRVDLLGGLIELPPTLETSRVRVSGSAYPITVVGSLPGFDVHPEVREVSILGGGSALFTPQITGSAPGYSALKPLREAKALLYINECLRLSCFVVFNEPLKRGDLIWEQIYFTCENVCIQAAPFPLPL